MLFNKKIQINLNLSYSDCGIADNEIGKDIFTDLYLNTRFSVIAEYLKLLLAVSLKTNNKSVNFQSNQIYLLK